MGNTWLAAEFFACTYSSRTRQLMQDGVPRLCRNFPTPNNKLARLRLGVLSRKVSEGSPSHWANL
jgi:hypothetical protein